MSTDRIKTVSEQILNRVPAVRGKGEQATKQSLILPMLDVLGYDIWSPAEVCPEYEADFAIKKAGQKEKVDIAILLGGIPRIYIESKPIDDYLDGHEGQLARYFNATRSVTLGILTNGLEWRFFTDTGDPNVMDAQPFHIAKLDSADQGLDVLLKFAKTAFVAESIRDYATELRYTAQIASYLRQELDLKDREPSEYFVRWILKADKMYGGIVNNTVLDRFRPIVKDALTRVIREIVRRSINAMEQEAAKPVTTSLVQSQLEEALKAEPAVSENPEAVATETDQAEGGRVRIKTTENELRALALFQEQFARSPFCSAVLVDGGTRKEVPVSLYGKDTTAYYGIYLNKSAWWLVRMNTDGKKNWIGFNLDESVGTPLIPEGMIKLDPFPFSSFRIQLGSVEDIPQFEPLFLAVIEKMIKEHGRTD